MDTISVKVQNDGNINKYISIIRKETGKSIAEIKKAIENSDKIIECDYYESEEINRVILVIEYLIKSGAKVEIYEDNSISTLEKLKNLVSTYEEIRREREALDEIMYGDD
ncbi:hypothetical protein NL50_00045 [Clostridium acetobutylicum]|nr:hypothetical protein NL50_00045 [Clostridium acetobutylicum]